MPSRTTSSPHPRPPFLPSSCHREERSDVATCCSRAITPSPAAPTTPLPSAAGLSTHQSPAKRPSLSQSTSGQSQPHPPPAHRSQMRPPQSLPPPTHLPPTLGVQNFYVFAWLFRLLKSKPDLIPISASSRHRLLLSCPLFCACRVFSHGPSAFFRIPVPQCLRGTFCDVTLYSGIFYL